MKAAAAMHPYPGGANPYPTAPGFGAPPGGAPPTYADPTVQQHPGAPMSSPFAAGQVRASPFAGGGAPAGAPPFGGGAPGMGAPPTSAFGAPPTGMAPPAAASPFGAPPTAGAFGAPPTGGAPPMANEPPPAFGAGAAAAASSPAARGPAFYPTSEATMGMGMGGGGGNIPGVPGSMNTGQDQTALLKDIEMFNSPPHFLRSTISRLPASVSLKAKCNIPLGIVLQPLAPLPPEEEVASVNHGAVGSIVRCKQCRTYINPFVHWEANGKRWTCNLCGYQNTTMDTYINSLDERGMRIDRFQKPELCKGAVEYIAPGEYMVRPPQPPVFMFVIDVSYTAVVTGMLDTVVASIKETIQSGQIPGGQRVQMGIMTFDTSLHFYNLNSNLSTPQMLVVSDLEDLFLPLPDDILVPVSESESAIINLLDTLPSIFADTKVNESCMGSAVKGAYMAMKHIGGKLCVFGACIPSVGELSLKSTRDNARLLGTEREVELLRPVSDGYKDLGAELTRAQISVEMFLAPQQYIDLASISPLAKYTGGDVRFYPQFHIQHSGFKLKSELMHVLTRYMGWEAVMRVRLSRGWKITKFYGHLFIRGQDLLVVPNCHADQTFAISFDMEENVQPDPVLCVQSALLYTNCEGERRIRVHTWAGLTTQNYADIIASVDVQATTAMLSQVALEHSLKTNLVEGRNKLHTQCQQIVQASTVNPNSEALQFLPLYIMGMLKSQAFRATNDISADLRTFIWTRLETLTVSQMAAYYYPRMMSLHNAPDSTDEHGRPTLPEMLNLTSESMQQDGIYLLEDGETMMMWIGRAVDAGLLQGIFGAPAFDQLDPAAAEVAFVQGGLPDTPLARKVWGILQQVRTERPVPYMQLKVIRCGDPLEARFFASLIEDRTIGLQSTYTEFLQHKGYRMPQQQQQAPPAQQQQAPPGAPPAGGPPMGAMAPPTMRR